ncbi:hypothetical protein BJ508DRAFT_372461 [Ascobolus immersus RN42]|uniref:Uncharacterized protein n=1 Tax=Ascobolus immersus RN42 TaxID=1160509 RepID=A0A3N4IKM5_ASCIM|nr:hypothetical protein BJ508DRAFT_372461 [Ascobolus immersus RN42]
MSNVNASGPVPPQNNPRAGNVSSAPSATCLPPHHTVYRNFSYREENDEGVYFVQEIRDRQGKLQSMTMRCRSAVQPCNGSCLLIEFGTEEKAERCTIPNCAYDNADMTLAHIQEHLAAPVHFCDNAHTDIENGDGTCLSACVFEYGFFKWEELTMHAMQVQFEGHRQEEVDRLNAV